MLLLEMELEGNFAPIGVSEDMHGIEQYLLNKFVQVTKVSYNEYYARREADSPPIKFIITSLILL